MNLTRRTLFMFAITVLIAIVGLWACGGCIPAPVAAAGCAAHAGPCVRGIAAAQPRHRGRRRDARARAARPRVRTRAALALGAAGDPALHAGRAGRHRDRGARRHRGDGPEGATTTFAGLPVGLGRWRWPVLRGRVRGAFGLAWWTRRFPCPGEIAVEPDLRVNRGSGRSLAAAGPAQRALVGSGSELHELREYRPGDPLRSIDWKASARAARWIARDRFADQHLEIMMMLDVGRTSGVAIDRLTRLGHYVNAACRFAEHAVQNEDRVGLVTFADVPLLGFAPGHGMAAVSRLRAGLAAAASLPRESNPLPAAVRALALCRQRALVILMLDLDDVGSHGQLGQAVRLLRPKHLPVVCGLLSPELFELQGSEARRWLDPYTALAAGRADRAAARGRRGAAPARRAGRADLSRAVRGNGVCDLRPDARASARLTGRRGALAPVEQARRRRHRNQPGRDADDRPARERVGRIRRDEALDQAAADEQDSAEDHVARGLRDGEPEGFRARAPARPHQRVAERGARGAGKADRRELDRAVRRRELEQPEAEVVLRGECEEPADHEAVQRDHVEVPRPKITPTQ